MGAFHELYHLLVALYITNLEVKYHYPHLPINEIEGYKD